MYLDKPLRDHTLDHIGADMNVPGVLLDQHFQAAHRLISTRLGSPTVEPRTWHFKDHFVQYEELEGAHRSVFKCKYLCLYEQPDTDTRQGGYGHIEDFLGEVPASGLYDIAVWDAVHPTYSGHQLMADEWVRTVEAFYGQLRP